MIKTSASSKSLVQAKLLGKKVIISNRAFLDIKQDLCIHAKDRGKPVINFIERCMTVSGVNFAKFVVTPFEPLVPNFKIPERDPVTLKYYF